MTLAENHQENFKIPVTLPLPMTHCLFGGSFFWPCCSGVSMCPDVVMPQNLCGLMSF
ncbi:hypothetical protein Rcae01_03645 [Novipirellula caenicola]|uniref:Uncharacterized protein n=1 Tax=Novipirellula caenicola TaxID=1536901 RepID=A0ABP9VSP8_9BACT